MGGRKNHLRACKSCGAEELVRSDQMQNECSACSKVTFKARVREWVANNRDIFLKRCSMAGRKHGLHSTRIYRIHRSMLARCGHFSYRHKWAMYYEDKGIKVCDEWLNFESFAKWAFDSGYSDELTIDRIDGSKGYSPENCKWATRKEQQDNRSNSRSTRWSSYSECCLVCGTSDRRHVSKGMCGACYQRDYKLKENKLSTP